jgi:hypothetical protein
MVGMQPTVREEREAGKNDNREGGGLLREVPVSLFTLGPRA